MTPRTLAGLLRARAQSCPDQLALRLREGDGWTEWTWSAYWEAARSAQAGLWAAGVRPGHRVLMLSPEVRPAVSCLFGLWALGAVPIPVGLPPHADRRAAFLEGLAETASRLDARYLLVPQGLSSVPLRGPARVVALEQVVDHEPASGLPDPDEARGAAFVQLTSGTTSRPRGAVVLHERLMLHLEAMSRALPSHSGSVGVSWLPLHHDMGLVGGLLFPFFNGFPVHMLSTADFQRQPGLWLESLSRFRATITAAPPSAYSLCVPLATRLLARRLDLSPLACAMVGAEPISASVLRRFSAAYAPAGFRAEAFFPVYGLAEATVAVTFPDLLRPATIDRVDRAALAGEGRAVPVESGDGLELVSVGRAIPGTEVRIADDTGTALPPRKVGEIHVRSATLMWGYAREPEATRLTLTGGWLRTGDLGYQADGLLFVTGRKKELIIKGGHNLIPSALEEIVQQVEGVRPAAVAAVGLRAGSRETEIVCIVAETRLPPSQHGALAARIRAALWAHGVGVDRVVLWPPRTLLRTTSGKLQRFAIARRIVEGEAAAMEALEVEDAGHAVLAAHP